NAPSNVKVIGGDVEKFLERYGSDPPDYVVADPPRAGLGPRVCALLSALAAPRLAYVSCDPATLARDLKLLIGSGYAIRNLHWFDLFPQTFHIESVVELA